METAHPHRTLHILLLEDNPDDAALVEHELRRAELLVRVYRVDDRSAFEERLGPEVDLIISDYALPQFDALEALSLVQQRGLDIPFIIVSGVISEETAVEAMRRGAADYLLKDRLARLGQAVQHALRSRRQRRETAKATEAMRQSEALHRSVLASLPAHIAVLDESGVIISVNEAWEAFAAAHGNPTLANAGVGTSYLAVCQKAAAQGDDLARAAGEGIQDVLRRRRAQFVFEYPCHTPTEQCWFEMRAVPLHGGELTGVVVAHIDVTARRTAEESNRRLAAIVASSDDAILGFTPDGIITSWNQGAERLYGYPADEAVGSSVDLIVPEERRAEMWMLLERIGRGERVEHLETTRTARDGRRFDVSVVLSPIRDHTGRISGVSSVARDVTAHKRAQQALQESEARYRFLADHATDLITRLTPDGICLYASPASQPLLGFGPDELVGRSISAFLEPDDEAAFRAAYPKRSDEAPSFNVTYRARRKDGRYLWVETTGTVVWQDDGHAIAEIIGVTRDVTERKQYEQELIAAREHAEAMNRLKTTFLANMSHEIRTPLTAILGCAEILAESASGESGELARMIHKSGTRLMETLTSVLDLAQLEGGGVRIRKERCDLSRHVSETIPFFSPQAAGADVSVHTRLPGHPVFVWADRGALDRILTNLVSNAIKFTKQGSVTLTVEESAGWGSVRVADTGVGISRDFLPKLFQEFQQESIGLGRDYEGSGLGLAISQRLAQLMDGSILVESEKGRGSTFTLRLPLADPGGVAS